MTDTNHSTPTRRTAGRGRKPYHVLPSAIAALLIMTSCTSENASTSAATPEQGASPPSGPQEPGEAVWTDLASPVGMAYDTDGTLYVANWSGGTIERFTSDGDRSTFASGLDGPSGLAISAAGVIFAASYSGDVVWRFDETGEPEVFVDGLATPAGLSFTRDGELLIANRQTNEILAATPDGQTRVVATGLQTPVGAAELDNGDLMVSNINGGVSLVPLASGDSAAQHVNTDLASPGPGIASAGGNAVYVVDYGGSTVDRIEPDGTRTIIADDFANPTSIAPAPDGRLAIADWGTNSLYLIEPIH